MYIFMPGKKTSFDSLAKTYFAEKPLLHRL